MDKKDVKTIIFDLGGVYFTDGTKKAVTSISSKLDIDQKEVTEVLQGELGTQYRVGKISADEFWIEAKKKLNRLDANSNELAMLWLEGYKPIQGTVELIRKLKDMGYELIFLSDNVKERVEYLDHKFNFLKVFKDGVFSHIVGTRKPDPIIYKIALTKSSNSAEHCVYVDDKEALLEPARKLGMNTIHFQSPEQLAVELGKIGVGISL